MKKFIKVFIALVAILSITNGKNIYADVVNMTLNYDGAIHNYSAEEVRITVDGEEIIDSDMPPVIINDRTLVPARAVFEALGAQVAWNEDTKEVYMTLGSQLVILKIDSNVGISNGIEFYMDTPAKIVNDRTMIPIRAASTALGCMVFWDDETRMVTINSADYGVPSIDPEEPEEPTEPTEPEEPEKPDVTEPFEPEGDEIAVLGVDVPQSMDYRQVFTVRASDEIEDYEVFMLDDNRLVVDIYGAVNEVSKSEISVNTSTIVSTIRIGQNQTEPELITRIVLDLTVSASYTAELNEDEDGVVIAFDTNIITAIETDADEDSDYITIYGEETPVVNVFTLANPDRLIIDLPNVEAENLEDVYENEDFEFIDEVYVSDHSKGTKRIVVGLNKYIEFDVIEDEGSVTVEISKSGLDNLMYDGVDGLLILEDGEEIDIEDIEIIDDYMNRKYTIILPDDYENTYGHGAIPADDTFAAGINIETVKGNTQIEVDTKAVMATTIEENDDGEIEIYFVHPQDVYDKIIVLDPGHGDNDPGASGNGLVEKIINLEITTKVNEILEEDGDYKVYLTRDDDSYPLNSFRAQIANEVADLFVSVHYNASESLTANGTEVLYAVHSNEVGGMLKSEDAAEIMQEHLLDALGRFDRGIKERPDLIVLNQTEVPAVLLEIGFLSNEGDAAYLKTEEAKTKTAYAIYDAIVEIFDDYDYR